MTGLKETADQLVQTGKGILAADESTPTIGKRLAKYGLENTEEMRRNYREIFLAAPDISQSLSGCILYKETLSQCSRHGTAFVTILEDAGILPGIKVDEGLEPVEEGSKESHTKGLADLQHNCKAYANLGARFSKWRAAFTVSESTPSPKAIELNATELAQYASISQACNLVPIVEPEILIDGTHSIERSAEVASQVLKAVIAKLEAANVQLEGCLLKIQMVMPGSEVPKASSLQIAEHTLNLLKSVVPKQLAGIVFLSGGQSEEEATVNLDAINKLALQTKSKFWGLTFSYGRSLQASALEAWSKDTESEVQMEAAKNLASAMAAANASATRGQYEGPHPSQTKGSLKEGFRGWK